MLGVPVFYFVVENQEATLFRDFEPTWCMRLNTHSCSLVVELPRQRDNFIVSSTIEVTPEPVEIHVLVVPDT